MRSRASAAPRGHHDDDAMPVVRERSPNSTPSQVTGTVRSRSPALKMGNLVAETSFGMNVAYPLVTTARRTARNMRSLDVEKSAQTWWIPVALGTVVSPGGGLEGSGVRLGGLRDGTTLVGGSRASP